MKMYITRYALSHGIMEQEGSVDSDRSQYFSTRLPIIAYDLHFKIGKEAFLSFEEAVNAAESMRLKRIASLKKQISNLEKLEFWKNKS